MFDVPLIHQFRMPLNTEDEASVGRDHRFDQSVRAVANCLQRRRNILDRLVMVGVHADLLSTVDAFQR